MSIVCREREGFNIDQSMLMIFMTWVSYARSLQISITHISFSAVIPELKRLNIL